MERDYQLKLKEREHDEKTNLIIEEYEEKVKNLSETSKNTSEEKNSQIIRLKSSLEELTKEYSKKISVIEENHCRHISKELEKYKTLDTSYKNSLEKYSVENEAKELHISNLIKDYEEKLYNIQQKNSKEVEELESSITELEKTKLFALDDAEKEKEYQICSLKNDFESKIKSEEENLVRYILKIIIIAIC